MSIRISSILSFVFFCSVLFADDHEAPAAEAPAGQGDEHGGGGEAAKSSLPGWIEVESKISTLEAKVKAKEGVIEKLLEEKNHVETKDPKMKEIISELSKEHKEMRAAAEDLEKQRTILRYRFPERGADPKRKYEKIEIKSLKEMEGNLGVEGRLQRTFKRAQQQYGEPVVKTPSSKETSPHKTEDAEQKSFNEGSIILQK